MKSILKYNICRAIATLLLLLAMTHVGAQTGNVVYQGQTTELSVQNHGNSYTWELYNSHQGVNFAADAGNCPPSQANFVNGVKTGTSVQVNWLAPGIYFYSVKSLNQNGCSNLKVGKITVLQALPIATLDQPGDICVGDQAQLVINLTGTSPWSLNISDGSTTNTISNILTSPYILTLTPTITKTYTVTSVTDANATNNNPSNPVTLKVFPKPGSSRIYQYTPLTNKN